MSARKALRFLRGAAISLAQGPPPSPPKVGILRFLAVAPAGAVFSWVELRYHGSIVAFGWHSSVLVDQDFKSGVPSGLGVLRDID